MFPCVVGNEEEEEEEEVFPRGCADVSLSRVSEYSEMLLKGGRETKTTRNRSKTGATDFFKQQRYGRREP